MPDDDEDDKKFEERFNKLFHKAMGDREKRSEKKMGKMLEDGFAKFAEKLNANKKPEGDEDPDDEEDPLEETPEPTPKAKKAGRELAASKGAKLSQEQEARLRKAEKDAKEAKDRADKFEAEAKAEKLATQKAEERQALITGISGLVKSSLMDMVVDKLHKNIVRDEESKAMLWKDGEDLLPFKDALDKWKKSDEAKEVAPPKEVRGSGSRGPADGALPGKNGGEINAADVGQLVLSSIPR